MIFQINPLSIFRTGLIACLMTVSVGLSATFAQDKDEEATHLCPILVADWVVENDPEVEGVLEDRGYQYVVGDTDYVSEAVRLGTSYVLRAWHSGGGIHTDLWLRFDIDVQLFEVEMNADLPALNLVDEMRDYYTVWSWLGVRDLDTIEDVSEEEGNYYFRRLLRSLPKANCTEN